MYITHWLKYNAFKLAIAASCKLTLFSYHLHASLLFQGDQNGGEDGDPTTRVAKIFEQMDTDNDNKLTLDEFKEGSRNDPRIVQALSLQPDTSLA